MENKTILITIPDKYIHTLNRIADVCCEKIDNLIAEAIREYYADEIAKTNHYRSL